MADMNEDKNLVEFLESVLHDQTEKQILRLILEGKEGDAIIEDLLKASPMEEKQRRSKRSKQS